MARLSVTTVAQKRTLTTLARVKAELGITASTDDAVITQLLNDASLAIERYCRRVFARETVVETIPGMGDIMLQLSRTPVITVASVTVDGDVITDYSVYDQDEGTLYRELGWAWSAQTEAGFTGNQKWPGMGMPMPRQEEPNIVVTYTGGYVLPSQAVIAQSTISASSTDNSFNDSASGFPALLKAGDVIETSGFVAAANNGRFLVTGTPTTAKIVVSSTLTTGAAGASVTVKFQNAPGARALDDVEAACCTAVKTWYVLRKDAGSVVEKALGSARLRFREDGTGSLHLPAQVVGLLAPWVRYA